MSREREGLRGWLFMCVRLAAFALWLALLLPVYAAVSLIGFACEYVADAVYWLARVDGAKRAIREARARAAALPGTGTKGTDA